MEPDFTAELSTLLAWADEVARLKVMANADTPDDARRALKYGAVGIGLARTERMFNDVERLPIVIEMIVADTPEERQAALDRLLPLQRKDFRELFEVMSPHPVTIRLLDPPIHEFLPSEHVLERELAELRQLSLTTRGMTVLSAAMGLLQTTDKVRGEIDGLRRMVDPMLVEEAIAKKEAMLQKVRALYETNPMLGHRGVRLGITFPEIYQMQIRAILEAAAECQQGGDRCASPDQGAPGLHGAGVEKVKAFVDTIHEGIAARRPSGELQVRHHDRGGAGLHAGRVPGRGGGVLLLRHQRPDPGHLLLLPRGRGEQVPAPLQPVRHPAGQPLRGAGREGGGQAHAARRGVGALGRSRTCTSASAASTAATRSPSPSATRRGSTT